MWTIENLRILQLNRLLLKLFPVVFLMLYLFLSWNNRLAHDDFYSIYAIKNYGILKGVQHQFFTWCPRSFAVLLSFCVIALTQYFSFALFIWQLFLILFCVYCFQVVFHELETRKWIRFDFGGPISGALMISAALFFCVPDVGQAWFWTASTTTYLLSFLFLIYGIGLLFREKISFCYGFKTVIVFFVVGNSSEPQAVLTILVLIFLFVFYLLKQRDKSTSIPIELLSLALLGMILGFSLVIFAPGTSARSAVFPTISFFEALILNYKLLYILFINKISWKFFLLTGFGLVLGSMIRPTHQAEKRKIIFVLLAITALIEIFQFIITRVISDLSAERVYLPVTMFLICFFIMISWLFFFPRLYLITFALLFCYLGCVSIVQFHFIENYSIAYDKRMEVIRKDKDTSVVVFEPLPSSGLLLSAEISADTNAFPNQHLRMAYHRKFPVLVRSE